MRRARERISRESDGNRIHCPGQARATRTFRLSIPAQEPHSCEYSKDVLNPVKSREVILKPGEIFFVPKTGFARATYVIRRLNPLFQLSTLAYSGAVL